MGASFYSLKLLSLTTFVQPFNKHLLRAQVVPDTQHPGYSHIVLFSRLPLGDFPYLLLM